MQSASTDTSGTTAKRLSTRMDRLSESKTLRMARMSRELKAQGRDIISLSLGEPDFDTPDVIKEAAHQAIRDNYSHYPPVGGFGELKDAIADKLARDNGLEFGPSQIVVSTGAKQSLANLFLALLDPGDEILTPRPYWVTYPELAALSEASFCSLPTSVEDDFKISPAQLEEALNERTRVFLLCSPSNPCGTVYSQDELNALAEVLAQYPEVVVLSDEIYEYILFQGSYASPARHPELAHRTVVVNGLSKSFAMTGWRIGYIAGPEWIAKACEKLQGQFTSGANAVAQRAAIQAMRSGMTVAQPMVEAFRQRRDFLVEGIGRLEGFRANIPQGAFYLFPEVSHWFGSESPQRQPIEGAEHLCLYLLEEAGVSMVPGDAFGMPDYLRLSYAVHQDELRQALERIEEALGRLQR